MIPLIGNEMTNDKWLIEDGKAIIIEGDVITDIVDSSVALDDYGSHEADGFSVNTYDINGRAVIPGLIDSHTHLVWGGDRSNEVRLKQRGKS